MRLKKLLSIVLAVCLVMSLSVYTASGKTISKVGYGVRDLTLANPISSCKVSCATTVTKGNQIKISFTCSYNKTSYAKGRFLHDGWHESTHKYVTDKPTYAWYISKGSNIIANGSKSSYAFTPSSTGTYTVAYAATCKAKPNPSVAYVGIIEWTATKMPTITFTKNASSKSFKVVAPKQNIKKETQKKTGKTTPAKKNDTSKDSKVVKKVYILHRVT